MTYDESVNAWADRKLTEAGVEHTSIHNVGFDIEHDRCIGHLGDDYCYCYDDGARIVAVVFYFNGTKKCLHYQLQPYANYSFDGLLKELLEGG